MLPVDSTVPLLQEKFQKSYFDVLGLCCSSEVRVIERILSSLDGIKDLSVSVPTKTVIVVHEPHIISPVQIVKALNRASLEANIKANLYNETNYEYKWPSACIVLSGILLMLSFLNYFYGPLKWLAIAAVAVGIGPILLKAISALCILMLDINILALIAVLGSIALHDYSEAGIIVFLFRIAQWLELRATHKAISDMASLVSMVPQKAVLADTGEEVYVDQVMLNTLLTVKAGETIPMDGVVVDGNCEADEKLLTGESFPVAKQKDSTVLASSINLNGYITIRTTALATDCVVARMVKLVEDAQNMKSRTQRFMDSCAKYYTPTLVAISACLALMPLVFHLENKKEWYRLSLVALVSGCPCALLLSTPVAMFCALSKATKIGVLFKGAEHLETLAAIKIMALDKTGTITTGDFVVEDFRAMQPSIIEFDTLLHWISCIESKSSHPMAATLVNFARAHEIEPEPAMVKNFQIFPGEGVFGSIEGMDLYVGSWKVAARAGCLTVPKLEGCGVGGNSVGYVFLGSTVAAIFRLSDACRTGVKEALEDLKSIGIKTVMLSGDSYAAANQAQAKLGGTLHVVHAELLPQDKERMILELKKQGPTAMIGDGINDAPALATADIGISMGISGSALASETGDVILMTNNIRRIPQVLRIAKKARRKIVENVIMTILIKAVMLGIAIAGYPLVWAAVLADVGTCLIVIFNSMLLLQGSSSLGTRTWELGYQPGCCTGKSCKPSTRREPESCCSEKRNALDQGSSKTRKCCMGSNTVVQSKCCDNLRGEVCSSVEEIGSCNKEEPEIIIE